MNPFVVYNPDNEKWEVRLPNKTLYRTNGKADAEQIIESIKNRSRVLNK